MFSQDGSSRDGWTEWHIYRSSGAIGAGIGPKTLAALSAQVDPIAAEWLAGPEYARERQREIARFIARTAEERFGLHNAKEHLAEFRHELAPADLEKLTQAFAHLESGARLLASVGAAEETVSV